MTDEEALSIVADIEWDGDVDEAVARVHALAREALRWREACREPDEKRATELRRRMWDSSGRYKGQSIVPIIDTIQLLRKEVDDAG